MKAISFVLFIMLGLIPPAISQIGAKVQQQQTIYGTWENSQLGYTMSLILQPDGKGSLDGDALTFVVKNNMLSITQFERVTEYNYSLGANTLQLSGGDLPSPVSFVKAGTSTGMNTTTSGNANLSNATPGGDITGTWTGSGETIEFKSNGQCSYLGQTFPYRLSPGQVTLSTANGDVTFSYTVSDQQLTLSANQGSVTYTRSTSNAGQNQGGASGTTGTIDQTMVGKWCYVDVNSYNSGASSSSLCVTLNADGTYEYSGESSRSVNTDTYAGGTSSQQSDRGTWYVQGGRFYYNSQTKGTGSFTLEKRNHPKNTNDPMLVFDGTPYVSSYNKPPW